MKSFKKILLPLLMVPALGFSAMSPVPVDHVYSPAGFNSNDNAQIAITGFLPNLCYQAPKSVVSVKNGKINVAMQASYKKDNGMMFCVNIKIPYVEYVDVGVLDKGQYDVLVNEATKWSQQSKLSIAEVSSSSSEEVVYANVEEVVRVDSNSRKVLLKGYNPSDCFELKEIVIKDNGSDTYSILPQMKQVRAECPKKMIPFSYEFDVPENLEASKVLLHVRVMDGRSVNAFFNNSSLVD